MPNRLLRQFVEHLGSKARVEYRAIQSNDGVLKLPYFYGKFWSDAATTPNIHQMSYRACFKPALVEFMIEQFSNPEDWVYDPFAGRGTVPVEAARLGRKPQWSDVNPTAFVYTWPRLRVPSIDQVVTELNGVLNNLIPMLNDSEEHKELLNFFHPDTLNEILNIRDYVRYGIAAGDDPAICLAMLVMARLSGNSANYLSTFTMPGSAAVNAKRQAKINEKYIYTPTYRSTRTVVISKYKRLYRNTAPGNHLPENQCEYHVQSADEVSLLASPSLIVTSPPFLDEVDYKGDNWLRCWFLGIDSKELPIWQTRDVSAWRTQMAGVMRNLYSNSASDAVLCWETGEVRQGTIDLAEHSAWCAEQAGWKVEGVLIHSTEFNKVANTWGVDSNVKGTNTNRVLLASK